MKDFVFFLAFLSALPAEGFLDRRSFSEGDTEGMVLAT
jgi:hypothetical protein